MADNNRKPFVTLNRFGEPQIVKGMKPAKSKDGAIDAILVCYVELKGTLYKIAVTDAKSDKAREKGYVKWCSVTKKQARSQNNLSM